MYHSKILSMVLGLSLALVGFAQAEDVADANLAVIKKELKKMLGGEEPDSVTKTPFESLYEVVVGTDVVYISADAKYLFYGNLIDRKNQLDLTRQTKEKLAVKMNGTRKKALASADASKAISYKAKDEKTVLTIFTDIDCPYCAKIHKEVPELNKQGITVNYLMFPRAGVGSSSFKKAVSAWCAEDQKSALTKAKERQAIPDKTCDNPVEAQYKLGQKLGVTGTPALITASGELIPGYVPAAKLAAKLLADSNQK
ncbi:MAG TPA: DsbC family protein [Thiothrix sp.]|nr:DsbC family protein [Thiothrix sp.]